MSLKSFLLIVVCLALISPAVVSAQETADTTPASHLPYTTTLPKDYPVVSVEKPCPKSAAKRTCTAVVTREEFEDLVNYVNAHMIKPQRRELAETYARVLALSQEALRRGLDRNPRVAAELKYVRLQTLANATAKEIYLDSLASPSEDAEKFYATHKALFERFNFERLYIPKEKRGQPTTGDLEAAGQQSDESHEKEMKELAEQMYARAQAGEDFAKLQKEVFQQTGITSEPTVKVEDLRHGDLTEQQNVAFDLTAGKISPLIADYNGYFIYKMISREIPPFEAVREQVTVRMQNDKSTQAVKNIEKLLKAKVNEKYFEKYDPPPPDPNEPEVESD